MAIAGGLGVLLLLLPALGLGGLWVRAAWRTQDLRTCLTLGAVVGFSAHLVALNALCYLWPPERSGWGLLVVEAGLLAWAVFRGGIRGRAGDEVQAAQAGGKLPLFFRIALGILITLWVVEALRFGPTDVGNHSAVTGLLTRHTLPVSHPYDPAQALTYHYGPDLLGASLGAMTGLKPWWVLHVWTAVLAVLLFMTAREFIRAAAQREGRAGVPLEAGLCLLLFLLAGGFQWVNWVRLRPGLFNFFEPSFSWDGLPSLFRLQALAAGWIWWLAVWTGVLRWPRQEASANRACSPAIPFGLMLGALMLLAEHAGLLLGLALLVVTLHRLWRGRSAARVPGAAGARGGSLCPDDLSGWVAAGMLSVALALVQGGMLTGLFLKLPGTEHAAAHWTGTFWPTFPDTANYTRVTPHDGRYWQVYFRDLGLAPPLAVVLCLWAFRRDSRAPLATRILLAASWPGLLLGLYLRPADLPSESFRFSQFFAGCVYAATGFWLARAWLAGAPAWRRALAVAGVVLLCLQGLRVTTVTAVLVMPCIPFDYDAGQEEALKAVAARGQAAEGILSEARTIYADPVPPVPAILGRPLPFGDPKVASWFKGSPAWKAAVAAPSPVNLRAARMRWVCVNSEDLPRAVVLLEGLDSFERVGPPGRFGTFRLYRYAGPWEIADDGFANLRRIMRRPLAEARLGEQRLPAEAVAALMDGLPETGIELDRGALARDGLAGLLPGPQVVNAVWLDGGAGTKLTADELDFAAELLRPDGGWTPAPGTLQWLRSPGRPESVLLRFAPCVAQAVRVRFKPHRADGSPEPGLKLVEFWVGLVTERATGQP
jgi:hypothetical protein